MGAHAGDEFRPDGRCDTQSDRGRRLPHAGLAGRYGRRERMGHATASSGAAAFAQSRRGDGTGIRGAFRQSRTKSHARPSRHSYGGLRGCNELTEAKMSVETIFRIHLGLGYVAWLLCFGAYIWPWLRSMENSEAQRAIATLHSFRFFGLVFLLPGVTGDRLPADFTAFSNFSAYGDFATGLLAILALLTFRVRPLFVAFVVAFNLVGVIDLLGDYTLATLA